jgi:hypothetical protein
LGVAWVLEESVGLCEGEMWELRGRQSWKALSSEEDPSRYRTQRCDVIIGTPETAWAQVPETALYEM